jgi:hypothetical protein
VFNCTNPSQVVPLKVRKDYTAGKFTLAGENAAAAHAKWNAEVNRTAGTDTLERKSSKREKKERKQTKVRVGHTIRDSLTDCPRDLAGRGPCASCVDRL